MQYINHYDSPLGTILLAADDEGLTGLWFDKQKYYARNLCSKPQEKDLPVFTQTKKWLDTYFSAKNPGFTPTLHLTGTDFQMEVWDILRRIKYGETKTYGFVANVLAKKKCVTRVSAQAVGNAISHNPVSIIVPCHRVIGADGSLTSYAGGLDRKAALLKLEGIDINR